MRRKLLQKTNVFCIYAPKPRQTNAFRKMDRICTEDIGKQKGGRPCRWKTSHKTKMHNTSIENPWQNNSLFDKMDLHILTRKPLEIKYCLRIGPKTLQNLWVWEIKDGNTAENVFDIMMTK